MTRLSSLLHSGLIVGAASLALAVPASAGQCADKAAKAASIAPSAAQASIIPASYSIGHHETAPAAADIVDTAVAAGAFNTLVAAVTAADLVDVLKSEGPFTVFAPTDAAFAKLPAGFVADLLKPENKAKLQKVLTLHVIPGAVLAADLAGGVTPAETVSGETVIIDGTDGVRVGTAHVTTADVKTSNGVIHVIDRVLIPAG